MPARLNAIVKLKLKRSVAQIKADVDKQRRGFGLDLTARMNKYPPQQPTTYRRTGDLGKGWRPEYVGLDTVLVINNVPYAAYVQGPNDTKPGQSRVMAGKGWQRITDEAEKLIRVKYPAFQAAVRVVP